MNLRRHKAMLQSIAAEKRVGYMTKRNKRGKLIVVLWSIKRGPLRPWLKPYQHAVARVVVAHHPTVGAGTLAGPDQWALSGEGRRFAWLQQRFPHIYGRPQ